MATSHSSVNFRRSRETSGAVGTTVSAYFSSSKGSMREMKKRGRRHTDVENAAAAEGAGTRAERESIRDEAEGRKDRGG